jgi:hypothetical protein
MRRHALTIAIVICLAFFWFAGLSAKDGDADGPGDGAVQWEHLAMPTETGILKGAGPQINKLGDEGWELVDVETTVVNGTTRNAVYFFKRLK